MVRNLIYFSVMVSFLCSIINSRAEEPSSSIPTSVPVTQSPSETPELTGTLTMPSVIGGKAPIQVKGTSWERTSTEYKKPKNLWADAYLFLPLPLLNTDGSLIPETQSADSKYEITAQERIKRFIQVEEWYGTEPENLQEKYILLDFSASWCPVCRREIPMLNHWHEKYGKELAVISIYETDRKSLDTLPGELKGKDMKYFVGIDTRRRSAGALGVFGIPHVILIEPQYGYVVWEGMPSQPGYELTDEIIERVLAVGRKNKKK